MTRVRLAFANFWPDFDPRDNYFTRLISAAYDVEISDRPDFLIYSNFGTPGAFRRYRCIRIHFTGEYRRPDFTACDYALGFEHTRHPRYYRLPLYALYADPRDAIKRNPDPAAILASKTGFCNFVYSNPFGLERNRFFHALSKYKRVDAGGRLFNNIGGPIADKIAFIRPYKFTIAFENARHRGYTTEKIFQPMLVDSLPIYWGNPQVARDFNTKSFLNYDDYGSDAALIERVIATDRDDDLYARYVREPWYHGNRVNADVDPANVLAFFDRIFSTPRRPVAERGRIARAFFLDRLYAAPDRLKRRAARAVREWRAR